MILAFSLFNVIGLDGVAWAMSVAAVSYLIYLIYQLRKKLKGFPIRKYLVETLKILAASVIMGLIAIAVHNFMIHNDNSVLVSLALSIIMAVVSYGILLLGFKSKPVVGLLKSLKK